MKTVRVGDSVLINGDCINILESMNPESVDLCVTDPPYLISYETNMREKTEENKLLTTEIDGDSDPDLIRRFFPRLFRVMKMDTASFVFCRRDVEPFFRQQAVDAGFEWKGTIVWTKDKQTGGDLKGEFGRKYEDILFLHKGRFIIRGKRHSDVWPESTIHASKMIHPNQKPLGLFSKAVLSGSDEGDVTLDCFGGSGALAIVSNQLVRKSLVIEKDEERFNVMVNHVREQSTSLF